MGEENDVQKRGLGPPNLGPGSCAEVHQLPFCNSCPGVCAGVYSTHEKTDPGAYLPTLHAILCGTGAKPLSGIQERAEAFLQSQCGANVVMKPLCSKLKVTPMGS